MARVPLWLLIRVFAWTGLTALGGGRSAYFYDAVVVRRSWVKTSEFVLLVPGALVLLALTTLYFRGGFAPGTTRLMHGMGATVVGLVLVATAQLVAGSIRGPVATAVAVATFLLVGPLGVNTAIAVCLVLPVSLWCNRPRNG